MTNQKEVRLYVAEMKIMINKRKDNNCQSHLVILLPDLKERMPADTPVMELALTARSLNSTCSTLMSQSVWIFLPRKYFALDDKK